MKFSKIFALLLIMMLIVGTLSVTAFASEQNAEDATVGETNEGETESGETESGVKPIEINFDISRFVNSLQYMWKGMLCIFIVIGVIVLITYFFNRFVNYLAFASEKKDEEQ